MGEPPFELLPRSHRDSQKNDLLCASVSQWLNRSTYGRNPRTLVGKRSRLGKTSLAAASLRPNHAASVLPYWSIEFSGTLEPRKLPATLNSGKSSGVPTCTEG